MPIEFRCERCNKLLRTGDDTAGKQARCPECGAVMPVPTPGMPQASAYPAMQGAQGAGVFGSAATFAPPESVNPYQSPTGLGPEPQVFAAPGQIRPTQIGFSEIFSRTWAVFAERWLYVLGAKAILFVIVVALSGVMQAALAATGAVLQNQVAVGVSVFFLEAIGTLVQIWLQIGMTMFLLGLARGEEPRFGLLFAGGPYLLPVLLCIALIAIFVVAPAGVAAGVSFLAGNPPWVALVLFLTILFVPGLIPVSFMLMYAPLLIIDRNMGTVSALSMSRRVMAGNKLMVFLIHLVGFIAALLLGAVTCLVGLAVYSYLYAPLLYIVIYLGVTGQPTMLDGYAPALEEAGGTPFGEPGATPFGQTGPGAAQYDSPFMS